jgi:hypothetical protein
MGIIRLVAVPLKSEHWTCEEAVRADHLDGNTQRAQEDPVVIGHGQLWNDLRAILARPRIPRHVGEAQAKQAVPARCTVGPPAFQLLQRQVLCLSQSRGLGQRPQPEGD